jgi:transposase
MVLVSGEGVPLGVQVAPASTGETALATPTLDELKDLKLNRPTPFPTRVIADRGFDSDPLRDAFAQRGVLLIAPHRRNRKRPSRNDGRTLRRYRRRWIVERCFGWLHNYRRLVTRYDRTVRAFRGFLHVALIMITLRYL